LFERFEIILNYEFTNLCELRVQKPQRGVILVIKADPSVFLAPEGRNIGSKSQITVKLRPSGAVKGFQLLFVTDIMHLWCVLNP
jgi:hypothetical protein